MEEKAYLIELLSEFEEFQDGIRREAYRQREALEDIIGAIERRASMRIEELDSFMFKLSHMLAE